MTDQAPNPSNPKTQAQSQTQQDQKGQYSSQTGGQMSSPTTSRVGNNIEKDEPLAQGSNAGGMKSES